MYGQMTAGSWIYIGTQGILQGTYETLAEAARQHFGGSLKGTLTLTGGLGGMGGAQPLAVTMNEGVALVVEVDETRIDRRIEHEYCDVKVTDLDEALKLCEEAKAAGKPLGRPKGRTATSLKLDPKEAEIRSYLAKGISKRSIAKLVECSPSTLYDWLARRNIRTPRHAV